MSSPQGRAGTLVMDPQDAVVSGTISANTTIWAEDNIEITGDVTIDTNNVQADGSVKLTVSKWG